MEVPKKYVKHGMTGTPEYRAWKEMKRRCYNPNNPSFEDYGGRGITISQPWLDDPAKFFEYVGKKPSKYHSIDRIDNDGNYEPGNVRWATAKQQRDNQRIRKPNSKTATGIKYINIENGRFVVRVVVGGKKIYLGSSKDIQGAKGVLNEYTERTTH